MIKISLSEVGMITIAFLKIPLLVIKQVWPPHHSVLTEHWHIVHLKPLFFFPPLQFH